MIGRIAGRLDHRGPDHVLIDTGGVGYVVYCSERTMAMLPAPGGLVALYTELVVREDLLQLYGFATVMEKEWHRLLTSVQGVGARGAMAILGTLGADGVGRAVALGDVQALRSAPGIGPKTADRIVLELKSRAAQVMALGRSGAKPAMVPGGTPGTPPEQAPAAARPAPMAGAGPVADDGADARADALAALTGLGYAPGDAAAAIAGLDLATPDGSVPDAATLIRAALRQLAPRV